MRTPITGAVTPGACSTQFSATCPGVFPMRAEISRTHWSVAWLRWLDRRWRTVAVLLVPDPARVPSKLASSVYLPVSMPPASGPHGMTASLSWRQSDMISRSAPRSASEYSAVTSETVS